MDTRRKLSKDNSKLRKLDALLARGKPVRPTRPSKIRGVEVTSKFYLMNDDRIAEVEVVGQQHGPNSSSSQNSTNVNHHPREVLVAESSKSNLNLSTKDKLHHSLLISEIIGRNKTARRLSAPEDPPHPRFSGIKPQLNVGNNGFLHQTTVVMSQPRQAPPRPAPPRLAPRRLRAGEPEAEQIQSSSLPSCSILPNVNPTLGNSFLSISASAPALSPPGSPNLMEFLSDDENDQEQGNSSTAFVSATSTAASQFRYIFEDFNTTITLSSDDTTTLELESPETNNNESASAFASSEYNNLENNNEPEPEDLGAGIELALNVIEQEGVLQTDSADTLLEFDNLIANIQTTVLNLCDRENQADYNNGGNEAIATYYGPESCIPSSVSGSQAVSVSDPAHPPIPIQTATEAEEFPLSRASSSSSIVSTISSYDSTPGGLKVGDKVIWFTENGLPVTGQVKWVGKIDGRFHAGVEFENPVGNSSGKLKGKQLFKSPLTHGRFVPVSDYYMGSQSNEPSRFPLGIPDICSNEFDYDPAPFVCVICQDNLLTQDEESKDKEGVKEMLTTKCGHLFHSVCLNKWFSLKNKMQQPCPYCQGMMNISNTIRIFPVQGKR